MKTGQTKLHQSLFLLAKKKNVRKWMQQKAGHEFRRPKCSMNQPKGGPTWFLSISLGKKTTERH